MSRDFTVVDVVEGSDGRAYVTLDVSDETAELVRQHYGAAEFNDELAARMLADALGDYLREHRHITQL